MKTNKYSYLKVIQQNCGFGWDDNSQYECTSDFTPIEKSNKFYTLNSGRKIYYSLLKMDLKEYRLTGYPTRVIKRRELNQ